MFIIDSTAGNLKREEYVRPLLPALLVFLALMMIIMVSWRTARQDIRTQRDTSVSQNAAFIESSILQRFSIYEDALRAANGLFISSDTVTRDEWRSFVQSLQLTKRYPGIRGVGYAELVYDENIQEFELAARDDGIENYIVYPEGQRGVYAPITYIVPTGNQQTTDRNSPALGFDMYSDPVRREAMLLAAKSGEPTLSNLVSLIQSNKETVRDGFLLYMPLYKSGMPLDSEDQRIAAVRGFFYAPFETKSIFTSLFSLNEPDFAFSIHDTKVADDTLVFESVPHDTIGSYLSARQNDVTLYGRKWVMQYLTKEGIVPYSIRTRPAGVLIGGGVFATTLAAIIYLLIQRRTRALAYSEQRKLEEAKDELLSLASHQLRTPATAVKQYISLVRDGFAGKVSAEQKTLLQRAYESNERQLTIVDDLLYVARVDAGQTTLHPEKVRIEELLESVLQDQRASIQDRGQKVVFSRPKKSVTAEVDPRYVRMIFENLLSNASKYSYEKTRIKIMLKVVQGVVVVDFMDRGVGIDEKNHTDVFKKFSRIPNELTRQIAGSGIGLYLAKQLATLHGGDITFVSLPQKGSTFTVTLPQKRQM